jgi:hypothetical protein
MPPLEAYRLRP